MGYETASTLTIAILLAFCGVLTHCENAVAQDLSAADQAYVEKFLAKYPKVASPPTLDVYATVARYDELFLGENLDKALEDVAATANDRGGIAWGFAARMDSLNIMYRKTGDVKYLEANLKCIQAVLAVTDEKRGLKLWTGAVVPAWGCTKYAERGRAVFPVHTGIITAPMFDFLLLAKGAPAFRETLGNAFQTIQDGATAALTVHDRQWRGGPTAGEGHYVGLDQENVCENKPLPGNRLSAMGWALWLSWKATGNETHHDLALGLGHYIRSRLTLSPDGAYYWPYWLPLEPVTESQPRDAIKGEDSSHAGLTMALPFVLAADGQVFTAKDLERLAKMVTLGMGRLGGGILFGNVTGTPDSKPDYVGDASRWLVLAGVDPAVKERIVAFYLNYRPTPGPHDLACLLQTL